MLTLPSWQRTGGIYGQGWQVDNIGCGSCVAKINQALKDLDAQATVDIGRTSGRASIDTDEALQTVCELLTEMDYPARLA